MQTAATPPHPKELLSVVNRIRYDELLEELSYLDAALPFYTVIGVSDSVLGRRLTQHLQSEISLSEILKDIPFSAQYSYFFQQLSPEKCYIAPTYELELDDASFAAHLLLNRDVISENNLNIIWVVHQGQYDALLQQAYDFTSAANSTYYFENEEARTKEHLKPIQENNELKQRYEEAKTELDTELRKRKKWWKKLLQPNKAFDDTLYRKWFNYAEAARLYNLLEEAKKAYGYALEMNPNDEEKALLHWHLGVINRGTGELEQSLINYQQSFILYEAEGEEYGQAASLREMGASFILLGQAEKGLENYKASLELSEKIDSPLDIASVYNYMAELYSLRNEYNLALEYQEKSNEIFRTEEEYLGLAEGLATLARIHAEKNSYPKAMQNLEEALRWFQFNLNWWGQAAVLERMGLLYSERGIYDKALKYLYKGLDLAVNHQNLSTQILALGNIGGVYLKQEQWEKGLHFSQKALEISEKLKEYLPMSALLGNIGYAHLYTKKWKDAASYFEKSLAISRANDFSSIIATNLSRLCKMHKELGKYDLAIHYGQESLDIAKSINVPSSIADSKFYLAEIYLAIGDLKNAQTYQEESLAIRVEIGDLLNQSESRHHLAKIYIAQNKLDKAQQELQAAHIIARQLEIQPLIARIEVSIGQLQLAKTKTTPQP